MICHDLISHRLTSEWANKIKVPSDISRIPNKIATGEGFSGFTANQWKTFILIYATTITWNLIKKSGLNEAHHCLLSIVKLIEQQYSPKKITPNMYLCLHIWGECW